MEDVRRMEDETAEALAKVRLRAASVVLSDFSSDSLPARLVRVIVVVYSSILIDRIFLK